MTELQQELKYLRSRALQAGSAMTDDGAAEPARETVALPAGGPWHFTDGHTITIVCPQWPEDMLEKIPYTAKNDPDYIDLLNYSELDALVELYGHLRAVNPNNQVNIRIVGTLASDDYSSHLVSLGGVDWNTITRSTLSRLPMPVNQVADWKAPGEQYFAVEQDGEIVKHRPVLDKDETQPKGILREDVALFARAVSPFNRKRTVTVCYGM